MEGPLRNVEAATTSTQGTEGRDAVDFSSLRVLDAASGEEWFKVRTVSEYLSIEVLLLLIAPLTSNKVELIELC